MTEQTLHPTPPLRMGRQRFPIALCLALALSPLPLVFVHVFGPRFAINLTESMPRGLYWRSPVTALQRGNIVIACIPHAFAAYAMRMGYLHDGVCDGVSTVLKYVAAIGGDDVTLTPRGVFVNGARLPGSTPLPRDERRNVIPHVPFRAYHLTSQVVWLYSPKPNSFDSRYYGPLNIENLQASAYAVITEPQFPVFLPQSDGSR